MLEAKKTTFVKTVDAFLEGVVSDGELKLAAGDLRRALEGAQGQEFRGAWDDYLMTPTVGFLQHAQDVVKGAKFRVGDDGGLVQHPLSVLRTKPCATGKGRIRLSLWAFRPDGAATYATHAMSDERDDAFWGRYHDELRVAEAVFHDRLIEGR